MSIYLIIGLVIVLLLVSQFVVSIRLLEQNKKGLLEMYGILGRADAIIAGASFRASLPYYCTPNILTAAEPPTIHIEEAIHPLIDNCVPNNITIPNGKGILITGSNMSGKTSFLRTVGINILFAQSLSLCLAREFTIPPLRLFSYMRIKDDVQGGKSYFIREVERLYEFLSEAQNNRHNFFLLDEIFKGTNTIERVAAATAVLSHLSSQDSYVMAATHDVELIRLLEDSFDAYYFSEEISEGEAIHFSHKIKKGGLKQGNAIKLLEYFQFPRPIIDQALDLKGKMLSDDKLANKENIP
ncbi:MAG: hypothetical protein H6560_29340 [Lewinellaceae bacterium]|nr:hypothetical protein [Lewinellaceae bacterium]